MAKGPSLLREELKRAWHELRGADLSPGRAAAAVALGLFIGSQPIFGCHTPLVFALCLVLRLDAALAWVASNISNPFFAPALITLEVKLGSYLHNGSASGFEAKDFGWDSLQGVMLYAFTGAPLVGAGLAAIGALVAWAWLRLNRLRGSEQKRSEYALPKNAPAWWRATEKLANRYAAGSFHPAQRSRFHYVRIKTLLDPITQLLGEHVSGRLLDIGSGRGQMAILFFELGKASSACGLDWDEGKVEAAIEAAAQTPTIDAQFRVGDMRDARFNTADTVLLIDVLHYITHGEQDEVVARAAQAVAPGGRLLIRDADSTRGLRSTITWIQELIFTTLRFNRGQRVAFRPAKELVALLEKQGLTCSVEPAWGQTPFSNILIVAKRPCAPREQRPKAVPQSSPQA